MNAFRPIATVLTAGTLSGLALAAPPVWTFQHVSGIATSETINGIAEIPPPRGGYIATGFVRNPGGNLDILVVRIRPNGGVEWRRHIGLPDFNEVGISVVPTFDGGFAVAGEAQSPVAGMGTFVLKLDALGGTVWARLASGAPFAPGVQSGRIREIVNNNLVVAGRAQVGNAILGSIVQLTSAGNPVWAVGYSDPRYGNDQQVTLLDIIQEDVGVGLPRLIAVGYTQRGTGVNREALAMSVAIPTGAATFTAVYNSPNTLDAYYNSVAQIGPGAAGGAGFAFAGLYSNYVLPNGSMLTRATAALVSLLGPHTAYQDFRVARSGVAWDSTPAIAGEFTLGGTQANPAGGPEDASLIRANAVGGGVAQMFYGGPLNDEANAFIRTRADVGFALAGHTVSLALPAPVANSDLYVIKTNADGQSYCHESRVARPSVAVPGDPVPLLMDPFVLQVIDYQPANTRVTTDQDLPCFACPADLNIDGVVDFNDFLVFLNLYNAGHPDADVNQDGVVDFNDFLDFLNLYNAPCP